MSFAFMFKQGSSSKAQPRPVRKETLIAKLQAHPSKSVRTIRPNGSKTLPKSVGPVSSPPKLTKKRLKPSTPAVDFGSDESDESNEEESGRMKRARPVENVVMDLSRQVRSEEAFSTSGEGHFSMIHAADIPLLDKSVKFAPIFAGVSSELELELQYPSRSQTERYRLIKPQSDDDAFHAIRDMTQVMRHVVENYIPDADQHEFDNEISGYPQRLHRAVYRKSESDLRKVMTDWNTAVTKLLDTGVIARVLDGCHHLDSKLVERILSQAYSRTVSPRLKLLHRYEAGTDNVYGELLPKFISDILKKDLQVKSDQVFVDLGSGVGNVVLQAALEIGCESWGCEMMKDYCDVAEFQRVEFDARCRLWGLAIGAIHLERGDFLSNTAVGKALQRADVVLVNNQVFTPTLNERLTSLFLDLKEGCRVVSLKSFVPAGHKISARNLNSPYNVLQVVKKEYFSNCVSWTSAGGSYYISTKDSSKIKAFAARDGNH